MKIQRHKAISMLFNLTITSSKKFDQSWMTTLTNCEQTFHICTQKINNSWKCVKFHDRRKFAKIQIRKLQTYVVKKFVICCSSHFLKHENVFDFLIMLFIISKIIEKFFFVKTIFRIAIKMIFSLYEFEIFWTY